MTDYQTSAFRITEAIRRLHTQRIRKNMPYRDWRALEVALSSTAMAYAASISIGPDWPETILAKLIRAIEGMNRAGITFTPYDGIDVAIKATLIITDQPSILGRHQPIAATPQILRLCDDNRTHPRYQPHHHHHMQPYPHRGNHSEGKINADGLYLAASKLNLGHHLIDSPRSLGHHKIHHPGSRGIYLCHLRPAN